MAWGFEVPDWRPGVIYFMPTDDGREIGIYPELFGAAKVYRGPLACDFGYDEWWRYETVADAIEAVQTWDGVSDQPPGPIVESGATLDEPAKATGRFLGARTAEAVEAFQREIT